MKLIPVILSGGVGSRLWPLSREHYPKQLLALAGEKTMLQDTVTRLNGLADLTGPIVVCNEVHRFLIAEQLRALNITPLHLILEPVGRNTAPAVAIAALTAQAEEADALILVLPADHLIQNPEAFRDAVTAGKSAAAQGHLVTFGVVPTRPETGYGYIKTGESLTPDNAVFKVAQFVEKPDLNTATNYLKSGDYYWNSGMFLFRADVYLAELARYSPDMLIACQQAYEKAKQDADFLRIDSESFTQCPANSVDYAVMEKTEMGALIPLSAQWSDVGAWSALWEVSPRDENENVLLGDVLTHEVKNCYLRAEHRLIAGIGLDNLIVIETADAVLIAPIEQAQTVKKIVEQLKAGNRHEANLHRRVHRPWGTYENIDVEERFQVKRIMVKPGASLSLQMHYNRSEHWIVVKGTAEITRGEEIFLLSENQSTYIPLGIKHRLANPGKVPLEIIEIQSGSYLGEDDIVRFEDVYGRQ
ncbi:mannose-1-phosphate guanylyltransferase/mannose-6-phosphate isomerase [Thioflexithrix psekupsensis]|uniref:mannose-1-phosphate guanylyltransferase n=1 Tax=Thioflexithrix psekupsensis TaxID=1570016 RepID=A0A251X5J6_9GAMM|nr:mannose-1-phosphate guanylyltransferase/mannose-6-phosphate isomerase [Thioflexithrix psekupsensis]OUD12207.1 mannose-1-phosphate guanylyltransferase/mannose-6-phosphate isomerase [Thioflexithrix psekupsensis]